MPASTSRKCARPARPCRPGPAPPSRLPGRGCAPPGPRRGEGAGSSPGGRASAAAPSRGVGAAARNWQSWCGTPGSASFTASTTAGSPSVATPIIGIFSETTSRSFAANPWASMARAVNGARRRPGVRCSRPSRRTCGRSRAAPRAGLPPLPVRPPRQAAGWHPARGCRSR